MTEPINNAEPIVQTDPPAQAKAAKSKTSKKSREKAVAEIPRKEASEAEKMESLKKSKAEAENYLKVLDGASFHQAGAGIAASQLFELLKSMDVESLRILLQAEPELYTRLVNSLSRLSDGQIRFDIYRQEIAERKARLEREVSEIKTQVGLSLATLDRIEKEIGLF